MGVERDLLNVSDLVITRPNRRGPGGDSGGSDTAITRSGSPVEAAYAEEERQFRNPNGREVITLGQFFIDPVRDIQGEIVPVLVGDLASWTDHQGVARSEEEIVSVKGLTDCASRLDVVQFSVGQTAPAGT